MLSTPSNSAAARAAVVAAQRPLLSTLALMEAHRADVTAKLAGIQESLELIDRKISTYRGRIAAGDPDPWAVSGGGEGRGRR